MGKPAFKNGKPLAKNGKPAATGSPCTCCGCGSCSCASLSATNCTACATSCTPTTVEVVLSGIVPTCCSTLPGGTTASSVDAAGATIAGTFTLAQFGLAPCVWFYRESPGTTFNFRDFASTDCTGSPSEHAQWEIDVSLTKVGTTTFLDVGVFRTYPGTTAFATYFRGKVAMACACAGTTVVNNGDGGVSLFCSTGGGTATVTFCP